MEENKTPGVEETTETTTTTETENKTYTQAEVETMLQKEADKRVTDALKKQERKTAEKIKEASKLAQMNEAEKFQYELDQREKAIAEKEKTIALMENKSAASSILAEKGISLSLVDFVVAEDAETMNANITLLDKAFKASVKAEVEKRLTSSTPKRNLPTDTAITKDSMKTMSLAALSELEKNNPELFKELTH